MVFHSPSTRTRASNPQPPIEGCLILDIGTESASYASLFLDQVSWCLFLFFRCGGCNKQSFFVHLWDHVAGKMAMFFPRSPSTWPKTGVLSNFPRPPFPVVSPKKTIDILWTVTRELGKIAPFRNPGFNGSDSIPLYNISTYQQSVWFTVPTMETQHD